jgi:hypothetical protein
MLNSINHPFKYLVIMTGLPSFNGTIYNKPNASISIKKRNKLSNRPLKLVGAFHAVEFNKLPLWVPGHHDRTPILEGIIIKIAPSN